MSQYLYRLYTLPDCIFFFSHLTKTYNFFKLGGGWANSVDEPVLSAHNNFTFRHGVVQWLGWSPHRVLDSPVSSQNINGVNWWLTVDVSIKGRPSLC